MTVMDLSRIDRTIDIDATPERVWRALAAAHELSAWFQVRIEGDLKPGGDVWMTSVHPDHAGQRFQVRIVEMTPPARLVWEWHPGAIDPRVDYSKEPWTTVTFSLEATARGTRLTVAETGFDAIALERRAHVYKDNSQGWAEVTIWLRDYAEGTR